MDEVKFRAWNTRNKEMMYLDDYDYLDLNGKQFVTYEVWGFGYNELMQYTGLKDKDGKEVYEGDVVSLLFDGIKHRVMKHRVEYITQMGAWSLMPLLFHTEMQKQFTTPSYVEFEILGNIYENPELMEGRKII